MQQKKDNSTSSADGTDRTQTKDEPRQQQGLSWKWEKRKALDLDSIYAHKNEITADKPIMVGTRLKSKIKEAIDSAAAENGMSTSEFVRRGLWLLLSYPELLSEVDADEAEYQSLIGPSRWHD